MSVSRPIKHIVKHTIAVLLSSVVLLMSGCSLGGPYFLDDGLRIAHDARTGQYLGEVIGECEVREGGKNEEMKCYFVRRRDGSVIKVIASEVRLSKP